MPGCGRWRKTLAWGLSLEADVGRRQAELGAAEDGGGALGIVADMGAHGMDIAPGALDRVSKENSAAAARLHQAVDRAHAPIDGFRGIPAIAGAPGQWDLFAG